MHSSDFPTAGNTMHGDRGDDELFAWSGGQAFGDGGDDASGTDSCAGGDTHTACEP